MNMKKFAASAASVLLMLCGAGTFGSFAPRYDIAMTASADYEFEFVDEDEAEDIFDAYAEDIDDYDEEDEDSSEERAVTRQFSPVRSFFISLIIGLIIAFAVVSVMKSSMKSVRQKSGAADYKSQEGLELSVKTDDHLGTKVERSPVVKAQPPTQQGTHSK